MRRRARGVLGTIAALVALAAIPAGAQATTHNVGVIDNGLDASTYSFTPTHLDIIPNDVVRWNWAGIQQSHNVEIFDSPDDSGTSIFATEFLDPENPPDPSYDEYTFTSAGDYFFHCQVHPDYMQGTIDVAPPPAPAFSIAVAPKIATAKVNKQATFTTTVKNKGTAAATGVTVCISGKAKQIAFVTAKCKNYPTFAVGAQQKPVFKVKPKAAAKGKTVTLTFTVDSAQTAPVKTTAKLKVPNR